MFYVVELQSNGETGASIVTAYPNKPDALAAAYTTAAAAVKSSVPLHTIMVITGDGFNAIDPMIFDHAKAQPVKE